MCNSAMDNTICGPSIYPYLCELPQASDVLRVDIGRMPTCKLTLSLGTRNCHNASEAQFKYCQVLKNISQKNVVKSYQILVLEKLNIFFINKYCYEPKYYHIMHPRGSYSMLKIVVLLELNYQLLSQTLKDETGSLWKYSSEILGFQNQEFVIEVLYPKFFSESKQDEVTKNQKLDIVYCKLLDFYNKCVNILSYADQFHFQRHPETQKRLINSYICSLFYIGIYCIQYIIDYWLGPQMFQIFISGISTFSQFFRMLRFSMLFLHTVC